MSAVAAENPRAVRKTAACVCGGCKVALEPFTVEHFEAWSDGLTLDSAEPFVLEGFQRVILVALFSGFREAWVIIPEGNAKTTLMALFALYHADHTHSPWVPIGAASRDQAEILFAQAAGFVERAVEDRVWKKERFRVYEGYRKIKCWTGGRGIKVYAADTKTGDGVIPTLAIVDELHRHDDLRLYRLWKGKLGKREGQIVTISTAGEPGAEFEEQRETIRNKAEVRERNGCFLRAEGQSLVYLEWMVPDAKRAKDLATVKDANPLSHITIEYLGEKLGSETLDFGEDWLRLTCNIPTRSSRVAIPESNWDALETKERIPDGEHIWLGADFAFVLDTTALVPFWPKAEDFRLLGDPEIVVPPRDGTLLDAEEIKAAFMRIHSRTPVEVVVMDKSRAEDFASWFSNELGLTVIDRSQGNTFKIDDYDRWMEAMRETKLRHTGDRDLRRHVLNAVSLRLPGEKHVFDRPSASRNAKKQERRVIDALTAASMVHSAWVAESDVEPQSAWGPAEVVYG